jgi:hypothetical protein
MSAAAPRTRSGEPARLLIRSLTCAVVFYASVACDAPANRADNGELAPIDTLMGFEHGTEYDDVIATGIPLECDDTDAEGRVPCSSPGADSDPGAYVLGFQNGVLEDMRLSLRGSWDGVPVDSLRSQMEVFGPPARDIAYGEGVSLTVWENETLERYLICFPPADGPVTAGNCEVWVAAKGSL